VTSPDFGRHVPRWLRGPGRPGWLPTQVPLRSGLAHHAHPVPHLLNSRPARSVVVAWTQLQVSVYLPCFPLRFMRRHPLPSPGFLRLVPLGQQYCETPRLPTTHFAALRFLRLAIPLSPSTGGQGVDGHCGLWPSGRHARGAWRWAPPPTSEWSTVGRRRVGRNGLICPQSFMPHRGTRYDERGSRKIRFESR
jgi:hypothetical protein